MAKPAAKIQALITPPKHRTGSPIYVKRVKNLPAGVKLPAGYVLGENGVIYDQKQDFRRVGRLKGWDAETKTFDPGRAVLVPPQLPEGVVVKTQANKQRAAGGMFNAALNRDVRLQVVKEGWLFKQGEKGLKRFKKRFFRLYSSGRAAYSLSSSDLEPIKIIPLGGATIKLVERAIGSQHYVFTVRPILKHDRTFVLAATTPALLSEWYNAFRSVDASTIRLFPNSVKEGYLRKLGHINKSWKMRYFVLLPDRLEYYEDRTASKPIKWIELSHNFKIRSIDHRKEFVFEVTPGEVPGGPPGALQRTFSLKAGNEANRTEWLTALRALNNARQSPWKGMKGSSPSPS